MAEFAVDDNAATCSQTDNERDAQWTVYFNQTQIISQLHINTSQYQYIDFTSCDVFILKIISIELFILLFFTFTFGEDSMLSSAEAVIRFGPMRNPEITKRLYKSLRGFCTPQKSVWLNLLKFCDIH